MNDSIKSTRVQIGELERVIENKKNCLKNKENYIKILKSEIEAKPNLPIAEPQEYEKQAESIEKINVDKIMREKYEIYDIPYFKLDKKGNYVFGTKKISTKILNNALVVRVGGGYVGIDEYFEKHAEIERIRVEKMMEKEDIDDYKDSKLFQELYMKPRSYLKGL